MVEADLIISSRLKALLPPLSAEEREQLEANIVSDGRVRDPILYWHHKDKNLIVDGMNRYEIAKKKSIPYQTEPMTFDSIEDAELWIFDNAVGRRNLSNPNAIRKLRGEFYNRLKRKDGGHGDQKSELQNATPIRNAAEHIAAKAGVSIDTVKRDGKRVEEIAELSPPLRKVVEEEKIKVTDQQLHALANATPTKQQEVARAVRTGAAKDAKEAMAKAGVKVPEKKRDLEKCSHSWVSDGNGEQYCEHCKVDHPDNAKRNGKKKSGKEKISAAKLVDAFTRDHVGKMVRGIDAIAESNGGKGPVHKEANESLNTLIKCLKKMRAGER